AYEKVLTDMLARYERRKGKGVFFLTGVDEHGMKVQQSAAAQNREPQDLADENAARFRALYDELDVGYDDFVRTTEDRHKQVVQRILQELFDKGEIYEGQYEGFYSAKQEQFLTDDDKVDGEWPADFGEVVHLQEKVYYFKLSQYQDWLVGFLNENPDWIYPSFRTKEVLGKLDQPIPDMCISRPSSRLSWGIPLPFDKDQVTFVWFDALINYISVIGYEGGQVGDWWPAVHVIGKDIMAPAHAVYWPIMLKAIGVPMPQRLLVHGFWTMDQAKMSKSEGNVVDPLELVEVYGRDAFRYYVLREMALGQDADFSLDQFHQRYQSELGNNLGNLLNRTVSMIGRYRDGAVPQQVNGSELETAMKADVLASISKYRELMDQWQVHLALTELWKGITRTNQYIEEAAPWKLAKDEARAERLDCVLNHMATALWMLGSELQPILPDSVERIF
ncbi:MAG: class I tRNA ligase family protein, partial [Verrucomicrobiota bacterium]